MVDEEAFGGFKSLSEEEWAKRFEERQGKLEAEFEGMLEEIKPDRLVVSNIWSVGENLAAAKALARVVEKLGVRTVAAPNPAIVPMTSAMNAARRKSAHEDPAIRGRRDRRESSWRPARGG